MKPKVVYGLLVLNLVVTVLCADPDPHDWAFHHQVFYWAQTLIATRREEVAALKSYSETLNTFMAQLNRETQQINRTLSTLLNQSADDTIVYP